ncbi:Uncharacterised protein [Vibrio cholerae]|nr:Uncharacterised protein [Vibrio cholerae]
MSTSPSVFGTMSDTTWSPSASFMPRTPAAVRPIGLTPLNLISGWPFSSSTG